MLSLLSGSCFAAIEFVNSYLFGLKIFSMGLSENEMRKFNQKRLFNVILCENVPQIIIQIIYSTQTEFGTVVFIALVSSLISVLIAWLNWLTQRKLMNDNIEPCFFSVKVTSDEVIANMSKYKNKTWYLKAEIARIFPLEKSAVEMLPCTRFSDKAGKGLVLYFQVMTKKKHPHELHNMATFVYKDTDPCPYRQFHFARATRLFVRCDPD